MVVHYKQIHILCARFMKDTYSMRMEHLIVSQEWNWCHLFTFYIQQEYAAGLNSSNKVGD
jgi:hypothetical protein